MCRHVQLLQSCPTLYDPVDCSPPGSSVRGIIPARILEWVAISYSRGLPDPGIKPASSVAPALGGRLFTTWAIWEALGSKVLPVKMSLFQGSPWPLWEAHLPSFSLRSVNGELQVVLRTEKVGSCELAGKFVGRLPSWLFKKSAPGKIRRETKNNTQSKLIYHISNVCKVLGLVL